MSYFLISAFFMLFNLPAVLAPSGPMIPDYQIHLLLDPTLVLDSSYKLTPTVLSTFAMPTTVTKINVQYLDTTTEVLYKQGWSFRIRNIENERGFDLIFKWRLEVDDANITGALNMAYNDGWNSGQNNVEAQIDWFYTSQKLFIQRDYAASSSSYSGTHDPDEKYSRSMLESNAPGTDELKSTVIYGSILTKRSVRTWSGVELDIEVWPIENPTGNGIQYLVEASFKTPNHTFTSDGRADLMALLQSEGWLSAENWSKEALVMENYHLTS